MPIRLDLNNPVFQEQWFSLEKQDRIAVLNCCSKLAALEWDAIYRDKGLRWELIQSRTGTGKEYLYSIRITHKDPCRCEAFRRLLGVLDLACRP